MAGRPSRLEDPTFLKRVAECFYAGMSRQAMADELEVKDLDTISRWRKDPRVKAIVTKLNEERVQQISRKVDSTIEARLANPDEMKTEDLIRIRKEYGGAVNARREADEGDTIAAAMEKLNEDPEFAERLARFIATGGKSEESLADTEPEMSDQLLP